MVFRSHPQLIQAFFNTHWFGPPPRVTGGSAWPWIDHPASGLPPPTWTRCSHSPSLRLRHGLGLAGEGNPQTHYAKGTQSPRRAPTGCRRMISGSVSLPWKGFFSPFPHGTCSLSVDGRYSALEGGPPGFGRSFTCSALLRIPVGCAWGFRRWGCHPLRPDFPDGPAIRRATMARSYNPAGHVPRFGLLRVRSPLLAESRLISSPQGTEMFHFPWCRPCHLCVE